MFIDVLNSPLNEHDSKIYTLDWKIWVLLEGFVFYLKGFGSDKTGFEVKFQLL